ncbi:hypothetical protein E2320_014408 [Naja naja]|nr:hypothetical protein E2320_014408 [Naja naja]
MCSCEHSAPPANKGGFIVRGPPVGVSAVFPSQLRWTLDPSREAPGSRLGQVALLSLRLPFRRSCQEISSPPGGRELQRIPLFGFPGFPRGDPAVVLFAGSGSLPGGKEGSVPELDLLPPRPVKAPRGRIREGASETSEAVAVNFTEEKRALMDWDPPTFGQDSGLENLKIVAWMERQLPAQRANRLRRNQIGGQ